MVQIASSQVGTTELTGKNDGEVEKYLRAVRLPKGNPYCVAAIFWYYLEAGLRLNIPNPAYSPNWALDQSTIVYQKDWRKSEVFKVKPAQVMLFFIASKKRIGHGELIEKELGGNYYTIAANVSMESDYEGDGVSRKIRAKSMAHAIVDPLLGKFSVINQK